MIWRVFDNSLNSKNGLKMLEFVTKKYVTFRFYGKRDRTEFHHQNHDSGTNR